VHRAQEGELEKYSQQQGADPGDRYAEDGVNIGEELEEIIGKIAAQHIELPVGKADDALYGVNQGQTNRHQGINETDRQSVGGLVGDVGRVGDAQVIREASGEQEVSLDGG
jgi:hypothetical protein